MTPFSKHSISKADLKLRMDISQVRPWILPILGTLALIPLLMHQSDSAVLFDRYSGHYSLVLVLYSVNLAILFRRAALSDCNQQEIKQPSAQELLSLIVLFFSAVFLVDFLTYLNVRDGLTIILVVGILVQTGALQQDFLLRAANYVAPVAGSVALTVIFLEAIFAFFLIETRTPKSQREYLRLMTSPELLMGDTAWPRSVPMAKTAGTIRIMGLSNSFGTFGGRTSNYHYLLESILRRELAGNIEMLNLSVPGYDPLHELAILDRFGKHYDPDLVVYSFVVATDFEFDGADVYVYQGIPLSYPTTSRYLPHNFLLRDWIKQALGLIYEERLRQREAKLVTPDQLGLYSKRTYLQMQLRRMNVWGNRSKNNIKQMENVFRVIDAIRSTAEENGARFVMVIHPDETQVNDGLRQEMITSFQLNEADYDLDLPQKVLRAYCAERKIPCLDLLPIFRSEGKDAELYALRDSHYNPAGQKLAAASISEFLYKRQLVTNVRPAVLVDGRFSSALP